MIYVSTGGFGKQSAWQTVADFHQAGISEIELSGGKYDRENLSRLFQFKSIVAFQVHNYFPPPKVPFVFNLASLDRDIAKQSNRHVQKAMACAVDLGRTIYSFHAGFLVDPKVDELGKNFGSQSLYDRKESIKAFIDRVHLLSEIAEKLGVELLIENNVLSATNFKSFSSNPFLMASADECVSVMRDTPANVNLLVDVAHLKVSANSLNFDPVDFLEQTNPWTMAYHLSDNDGLSDSNAPFTDDSWFWPYLKRNLNYYSVEVYNPSSMNILKDQVALAKINLNRE